MSREIRCTVTDEEYAEISAYVAQKKRWHKIGHFVRDCVFREMEYRPFGAHHPTTGKPPGRPRKPKVVKVPVETGENPVPRLLEASGVNVAGDGRA